MEPDNCIKYQNIFFEYKNYRNTCIKLFLKPHETAARAHAHKCSIGKLVENIFLGLVAALGFGKSRTVKNRFFVSGGVRFWAVGLKKI